MRLKQISFLIVLTALYLCFELAFNARLLDLVGGMADADDYTISRRYGRSLSGIAVALVVLQIMLSRRAPSWALQGQATPRFLFLRDRRCPDLYRLAIFGRFSR